MPYARLATNGVSWQRRGGEERSCEDRHSNSSVSANPSLSGRAEHLNTVDPPVDGDRREAESWAVLAGAGNAHFLHQADGSGRL